MDLNIRAFGLVTLLSGGLVIAGCSGKDDGSGTPWGGTTTAPDTTDDTGDSGTTVDDTGPTTTDDTGTITDPTDDTGTTEEIDDYQNEPGDVLDFIGSDGEISLEDESADSNKNQEFYAVFVNTEVSQSGFLLNYARGEVTSTGSGTDDTAVTGTDDTGGGPGGGPGGDDTGDTGGGGPGGGPGGGGGGGGSGFTAGGAPAGVMPPGAHYILNRDEGRAERTSVAVAPPVDSAGIGVTTTEFSIIDDLTDLTECQVITARLWGVGDTVAIWVDEDVAIDWDFDCDGTIDQYYDPVRQDQASFGFNNCDLTTVADIFDNNIVVNFRDLFGEESDINEDEKISVVISPVLNAISFTSEDEDDWSDILDSYADPVTDLNDFDDSNPCSDEQEVIYTFAPDPFGFYNSQNKPTVEEYTSVSLAAQIARGFLNLISYNQHVFACQDFNETLKDGQTAATCDAEEYWLNETMAAVGTDIVGFGSVYHEDAWEYLDAPHLFGLTTGSAEDDIVGVNKGAYYLFGRWLVDHYGAGTLKTLLTPVYTDDGAEMYTDLRAVEEAAGVGEDQFYQLAVQYHMALFASGVENEEGEPLVDADVYPQFDDATLIEAPTEPPDSPEVGVYYGANGYQTGFNIRGTNVFVEGGTTAAPEENTAKRVITDGADYLAYVPGYDHYGWVAGNFGAVIVRLTDLDYDVTRIQMEGSGASNFQGAVMRWFDIAEGDEDYAIETAFGATNVDAFELPPLPEDGTEILAMGDISDGSIIDVIDNELEVGNTTIDDTDRWLLDLTDRSPITTPSVQFAVWLQRLYVSDSGDLGLTDPWVAVVREDDLPQPTIDTHSSSAWGFSGCDEGLPWNFPTPVPNWISDQVFLSSTLGIDISESYDACGSATEVDTGGDTGDTGDTASGGDTDTGSLGDLLGCYFDWDEDGITASDEPAPASFMEQVRIQQCTNNGNTALDVDEYYSLTWVDGDEQDDDDEAGKSETYNIGGRNGEEGEGGYLVVTVDAGERYYVVVGGNEDIGPYQLHVKQLN